MDFAFVAKLLAKAIVLPPAGPLVIALAGLLMANRAPRAGRALAWLGFVSLLLLCMPIVANLLTLPFDRPAFEDGQASVARSIVILGGGTRRGAREYGGDTLGRLTLERVRYGAHIAKRTGLPVLVTGGVLLGAQGSEAALMQDALVKEYGVPVRWTERRSRNTHQNARFSAAILEREGIDRVVLVAHAIDMPRAIAEFADAGIEAIPAATGLPSHGRVTLFDFLPTVPALQDSRDALYELLANLVRLVSGSPRRTVIGVAATSRAQDLPGAPVGGDRRPRNFGARRSSQALRTGWRGTPVISTRRCSVTAFSFPR